MLRPYREPIARRKKSIARSSQFELHAIVGDFKAGIQHGAMFGAVLIEDGVGVIDVDQNAAAAGVAGELLEQARCTGERKMADVASGFVAAAGAAELVVAPKGAIDKNDVGGCGELDPFGVAAGQRRRDEEALAAMLEVEADGGFLQR